ncbi:AER082Wp [Eremothecium gossypii ATCC 10895]|uniref:Inositol hexakisphosphate and diphosphoinositol-pentakisphosphate kinase n=1 Tax=Eremothecium gossypii (strain ATCC 10895 / CBS 109.51 / FGSC 9923 / NRRL Y-1056) TaxID=284811 RepID=Q757D1_EREGS|nr:AER082Wp [Eremothecium gossypii ATCC 10895]AAS52766.1 AER082Wp [Eremothecium gossypii ATCC 10895]AEY97072.1 FAER082Wp [Eremothecium gossypii FDAG1]
MSEDNCLQPQLSPLFLSCSTKKAMESIAPILEGFTPKTSSSENTSLKLPPASLTTDEEEDADENLDPNALARTVSVQSQQSAVGGTGAVTYNSLAAPDENAETFAKHGAAHGLEQITSSQALEECACEEGNCTDACQAVSPGAYKGQSPRKPADDATEKNEGWQHSVHPPVQQTGHEGANSDSATPAPSSSSSSRKSSTSITKPQLPRVGKIGVCAMDAKVLSKPCRHILNRLIENGEFETIIFGDKVILDENIENWPTCDFLISFFSSGFPLNKAIDYVMLRKPFMINDLIMQKVLWDRRLCLRLLEAAQVPTPPRLEITRDGGPRVDDALRSKLLERGVHVKPIREPIWRMLDNDTLEVNGEIMTKPFVEKPVDGEDHNIYIYYHSKNGGGGRRLFRKVGNKSSEFDPALVAPRSEGSYIYEKFMDTDNFEDVKAYTVGESFCHAETRKSPVVDGIVRRNTHGKEIRYVTELTEEEKQMAARVSKTFSQMICGFDLLRVNGKSFVIDVNGFSFVKDNSMYYDSCAKILRDTFVNAKKQIDLEKRNLPVIQEEKRQKWFFKGLVTVIRHADRTPKQKFKHSFRSQIFISLLKGHKEEVVIRNVSDLQIVLQALRIAMEEGVEDPNKLEVLANALEKKLNFPGTKIQLKPVLNDDNEVEKVQFILKWGGEPTHSARYQAQELGEQMRQDFDLLNKNILRNIKIFSSSERRVLASAQLWAMALFGADELGSDEISIRKDLLDDSNAAKDLMDKVKKQLKALLREGKEAPPQFAWPLKMPQPYLVIKRVVELMNYHKKIMDHNFSHKSLEEMQRRWCCGEDPTLFKERWDKLFKEFVSVDKVDPAKISELYDTMKYDALHNRSFLERIFSPDEADELNEDAACQHSLVDRYPINILAKNNFKIPETTLGKTTSNSVGSLGWVLEKESGMKAHCSNPNSIFDHPRYMQLRELYRLSKVLFDFICPQEYGIEDNEKLDIGLLTSLPLSKQILNDIDDMKSKDTPACIAYFTKESHIYTLLNIIYEAGLPMRIARNALPELDYLSQINFELYESADSGGQKSHAIRLKMSPGCHTQDPLDVQLDEKHYISCIPRISLTKHLDMDYVSQKLRNKFSRVNMPQKFTPVHITQPDLSYKRPAMKDSSTES